MWPEEQVSAEALQSSYKIEESFVAYHSNKPIACMFLQETDSYYWPEVEDDSSLFLRKLAVLREFKARGIAHQMLQWASEHAKRQGKSWLRLDCHGGRPKLRQVYDWHCQVKRPNPRFSPKRQESCHRSIDARHLSPIGKSPGSEESMMNGLKMMTTDSKKVLDRTVN